MANYCISVRLAPSCCSHNYLQRVCKMPPQAVRGRYYSFRWFDFWQSPIFYCNGVWIGELIGGYLRIYPQFKELISSESQLKSIMSCFNLYPL